MAIRVLLADDHEVVRRGLRSLFEDTDIQVVAEASSGQEALKLVREKKLDVVLLDVRMPDMDGLNVLGRIKLDHPDLPVLMISTYDNPDLRGSGGGPRGGGLRPEGLRPEQTAGRRFAVPPPANRSGRGKNCGA